MRKFENFCKALKNLELAAQQESYSTLEETGFVAMFEICFEQSWKLLKEILHREGVDESKTGSPRQILKSAYGAGILTDEKIWLEILENRNILSHVYDADKVTDIIYKIKQNYLPSFRKLKSTLELKKLITH